MLRDKHGWFQKVAFYIAFDIDYHKLNRNGKSVRVCLSFFEESQNQPDK